MKKVTFEINGWKYNISTEDDFAKYLQSEISKDLSINTPDSCKAIIHAYINAKYNLFKQEQEIEKMIKEMQYNVPRKTNHLIQYSYLKS